MLQSQFFQESGQPGETFFLCERPSPGSAWTMQEFLGGTLEFGMCQVGCSGVLACFALVTKACNKHLRAAFFVGRR